jgi:hypothetical protein
MQRVVVHVLAIGRHAFLLLPSIAKPYAHNLLLELQHVRQIGYFLCGWLRIRLEVDFQRALDCLLDARALLALAALCSNFVYIGWRTVCRVGLVEPLGQQWLQFAHVLEAQLQRFESAYGRLAEHVAVQGAQGEPNIGLCEAELNASLFELFGKQFQVIIAQRVLFRIRIFDGIQMGQVRLVVRVVVRAACTRTTARTITVAG